MQIDFHYYATYCAAALAGYTHDECMKICYSAQFVDECSRTFLSRIRGPMNAATTQLSLEMMDARTDVIGLQDITRIWASFHFLPYDLYAEVKGTKKYKSKYRMICGPNGSLVVDTVDLAKDKSLQAAGVAMHVLADTWAHRYFAGTPSLVINNTNGYFYEIIPDGDEFSERKIEFNHNPHAVDDPEKGKYTNSVYQGSENSIMNLGHGRADHLPDYSWARYRYLPAWGDYREIIKDNPSDYINAFCQMVYALKYIRTGSGTFSTGQYSPEAISPWEDAVNSIILKRQTDASEDWKTLGEKLSGQEIEPFDIEKYQNEYKQAGADEKNDTFLGRFILAALAQKSMVTNRIYQSGNMLAGISVDFTGKGIKGIKDVRKLAEQSAKEKK